MDQAFACPECGTMVEIKGLAPGRQVRCGFCHRLLEVPFLPRVEVPSWKRRRYGRPWWVPWAWAGLGLALASVVIAAAVRIIDRYGREVHDRSIHRLLDSSEAHQRAGELNLALVDLDAAVGLYGPTSAGGDAFLSELKVRRGALVTQETLAIEERLWSYDSPTFPLGQWLTLQARAKSDGDLAPVREEIAGRFQAKLKRHIEAEIAAAGAAFDSGDPVAAHDGCSALDGPIEHVAPPGKERYRAAADDLLCRIIDRHGLLVEPPRGHFLAGPGAGDAATLLTMLAKPLKSRGYLPRIDDGGSGSHWARAPYRLSIAWNERYEGSYLSSENRLTRIDAHLVLAFRGKEIWKNAPTAKTAVPLPRLPAYLSSRLALGGTRIEEFERLLHDNARSTIEGKLLHALGNIPPCGHFAVQAGL